MQPIIACLLYINRVIYFTASTVEEVDFIFEDIDNYADRLNVELTQFKKCTVAPIWELRLVLVFNFVSLRASPYAFWLLIYYIVYTDKAKER